MNCFSGQQAPIKILKIWTNLGCLRFEVLYLQALLQSREQKSQFGYLWVKKRQKITSFIWRHRKIQDIRKGWFLKQCIANLAQRDEFIFCKLSNMADTCFDPGETHVGIQSSKDIFLATQLTQAFWEAVSFINRALKCTSITALVWP